MSKSNYFWFGWISGVTFTGILFWVNLTPSNQEALDNCAKTHNVYQCEMVAVLKTGEK